MKNRTEFNSAKRIVVKIGSSLLTDGGQGLDINAITRWVEQIAGIHNNGIETLLVSSGSVAEGMCRLGWKHRPQTLHELQAAASVGQMGLIQAYETRFQTYGLHTAQLLLTHEDLSDRQRYLNARSALLTLLELKVIPIINENDGVATEEIRFGDNDTLAAMVTNLVDADLLIILTDQAGLYEQDPNLNPEAQLIEHISVSDPRLFKMAGGSHGGQGRGGMLTKMQAAKLAAHSGAGTVIASGSAPDILTRLTQGQNIGTFLQPDIEPLIARKRWLAGQLHVKGYLQLDSGAVQALHETGKSLLAAGIIQVRGNFQRGDLVACVDQANRPVARGLINYNSEETEKIQGQASSEIEVLLGYIDEPELIHRDNLVLI